MQNHYSSCITIVTAFDWDDMLQNSRVKKRTTALLCRQYFEFETRTHEFFIICCLPEFSITLAHFDTKDYTNPLMTFHPAHMYIG